MPILKENIMTRRADITKAFRGYKEGDWVFCLHCQRVYQVGDFETFEGLQYCPYPNCSGDAVLDAHRIPVSLIPVRGKVYSMEELMPE
jgi:hypothetical protein